VRPEIKEYNYDWLLGKVLTSAAKLANASPKEAELMYRYIPNFKGLAKAFIDAGPPGIAFVNLLAQYYPHSRKWAK
jgi:hypothetical protein